MTELEKVIEEDNILVFLSLTRRIRACDLSDCAVIKGDECGKKIKEMSQNKGIVRSDINLEQLYQKGKPVHILLAEDMEQLQEADYIFQDNALWLRYGCTLHRKIIENSFQRYLDREAYSEDQTSWQVK